MDQRVKMNLIRNAVHAHFQGCIVDIEPFSPEEINVAVYYGTDDNSLCMELIIDVNEKYIYLQGLKFPHFACVNCKYTGPELLIKLYLIARQLEIETIELYDLSAKYFNDDCSVSLPVLSILQYGKTYYNRFGYYGFKRDAEHAFIQRELHRPFSQWNWDGLSDKLARAFRNFAYMPARLKYRGNYTLDEFKHELKNEGFEHANTLHDIGKHLRKRLEKSDGFCQTPLYYILRYIERRIFNKIDSSLTLIVNDPETVSLYAALEKKMGTHHRESGGGLATRHFKNRPRKSRRPRLTIR